MTPVRSLALAAVLATAVTGCATGPADAPSAAAPPALATTTPSGPSTGPSSGSSTAPSSPAPTSARPASSGPTVVASGLEVPWGLGFLPDGDALVTERDTARVLRLTAAGGEPRVIDTVDEAAPRGEGGLLGLAVSPTWGVDGAYYVYATTRSDNRVLLLSTDEPDRAPEPVLTGIPKGAIHNGGRLAFGPDGSLYAGTGDTGDTGLARDPGSLGGKVLRMTPDGQPVGTAGSVVFSVGHRNVQGLAFDGAGRLWATEFGQNRFDEVNQVSEGDDGGWPQVEGPGDGGGRFAAPAVTWETSEASPSGAAVVGDALYVAALRGERLWRVPLDGAGGTGTPEPLLQDRFGRLRAAAAAPDGSLWLLTSNRDGRGDPTQADDRVLRLSVPGSPSPA